MKKFWAALLVAVMSTPALGQQTPPDPATQNELYRRAMQLLQQQRNAALDDAVNLRLQLDKALEELSTTKSRVSELEAKAPKEEP